MGQGDFLEIFSQRSERELDPEAESGLFLRPRPQLFDGQGLGYNGRFPSQYGSTGSPVGE
uniref:Uncharacterized protein n=1 Tax=Pseudomonas syringae pv. actinidiae TaxID=103796 RepID=M1JA30_PSESF|nr:hypothetical protein [Pseudomonas syringae pv. actinidiae]